MSGGERARRGRQALVAAGLAVLAAAPYLAWGGLGAFVNLDDDEYVTGNDHVRGGLTGAGVRWALTAFHAANWHPLTWLSHMLDVSLFGLDPWWHHAGSVALHALGTALLFLALSRLTGAPWRSALAAALFAVHPVHVESVAWVAERKDVLSGLLFALVLLAYERHARRGGAWRLGAVVALAALGLAAKPMLVTLPCVLLLLDVWPLGRIRLGRAPARGGAAGPGWARPVAEKLPLFALSAASGAVTVFAQRSGHALPGLAELTAGARAANAVVSYVRYLGKSVWPSDLAVHYPHPGAPPPWAVAGALAVLAALSAAALLHWRRRPQLALGWAWFLGMLVPVIGVVQVGGQAMADRYLYLPLVGPLLAFAWSLPRPGRGRSAALAPAGAAALVALLCAASVVQAGFWRSSEALYRHALAVTSGNWLVQANMGQALVAAGREREALEHLQEAVRLQPAFDQAHNNLGVAYAAVGRAEEAALHYRRAAQIGPRYFEPRFNLANLYAREGRGADAVAAYREALAVRPDAVAARFNLANALLGLGRRAESVREYREALRLDPDAPDVLNNLAWALASDPAAGRETLAEAVALARRACELTGSRNPDYLDTLGEVLAAAGDFAGAADAAQRALVAAEAGGDPARRAELARRRDLYRAGRRPGDGERGGAQAPPATRATGRTGP